MRKDGWGPDGVTWNEEAQLPRAANAVHGRTVGGVRPARTSGLWGEGGAALAVTAGDTPRLREAKAPGRAAPSATRPGPGTCPGVTSQGWGARQPGCGFGEAGQGPTLGVTRKVVEALASAAASVWRETGPAPPPGQGRGPCVRPQRSHPRPGRHRCWWPLQVESQGPPVTPFLKWT